LDKWIGKWQYPHFSSNKKQVGAGLGIYNHNFMRASEGQPLTPVPRGQRGLGERPAAIRVLWWWFPGSSWAPLAAWRFPESSTSPTQDRDGGPGVLSGDSALSEGRSVTQRMKLCVLFLPRVPGVLSVAVSVIEGEGGGTASC